MDEDYLKKHYDLIVSGTGLVESMVACAAAKCGLSVLHLDRNGFYGGDFATFNLDTFLGFGKLPDQSETKSGEEEQEQERIDLGYIVVLDVSIPSRPAPVEVTGEATDGGEVAATASSSQSFQNFERISRQSRRFCIDLSAKLLLASSSSVDCFVQAGVSNYLEFKAVEEISFIDKDQVFMVPCTKSDVFNSRFLSAAEKRVLTKFLHFASDYGRVLQGTDISTFNEKDLAQGRALHRPQNKDVNAAGYDVGSYLDKSFRDFMTSCKISPRLQSIIIHALCLHIRDAPSQADTSSSAGCSNLVLNTADALRLLSAHLNSLGRYGETALLWPIYGSAELPQAFCRMTAVWGGVYILRVGVSSLSVFEDVPLDEPIVEPIMPVDHGASESLPVPEQASESHPNPLHAPEQELTHCSGKEESHINCPLLSVEDTSGHSFTCGSFLCGVVDFVASQQGSDNAKVEVRSVLLTSVLVVENSVLNKPRCLEIIPPQSSDLGNAHCVYVVQGDSSTYVCPDGFSLLYITTQIDITENASEVPSSKVFVCRQGAALREGEVSWEAFADDHRPAWVQVMAGLGIYLQKTHGFEAICSSSMARPLFSFDKHLGSVSCLTGSSGVQTLSSLSNVAVCAEDWLSYHICTDDAVEQAQSIFCRLFPGKCFMQAPEDVEGEDVHGYGGDHTDDEMEYLKATLSATQIERSAVAEAVEEEPTVVESTVDKAISGDAEAISGDVEAISGDVEAISGDAEAISGDAEAISGDVEAISGDAEAISGDVEASNVHCVEEVH